MRIGEVIRKHRKIKNLTQEEMANRLGVTAPAVNKWENGNSFPDIMLLAPIARLLDITPDTLLSFHEELTPAEIADIIYEMDKMMKETSYEEVFQWAKQKMEQYPNCEQLLVQFAAILDAQRMFKEIPNAEKYDGYILDCYTRALESKEEGVRRMAIDSLYGFYLRKEQYDKAEESLQYLSLQNPERKRRQAQLYENTGRIQDAYRIYEELLCADYQILGGVFHGMYRIAMQEQDMERAHMLVRKQQELARLFEMGKYHELCFGLELAAAEKDTDAALDIMEQLVSCIGEMGGIYNTPLYEHMKRQELREEFLEEMKETLLKSFQEDESFAFLRENPRYKNLF